MKLWGCEKEMKLWGCEKEMKLWGCEKEMKLWSCEKENVAMRLWERNEVMRLWERKYNYRVCEKGKEMYFGWVVNFSKKYRRIRHLQKFLFSVTVAILDLEQESGLSDILLRVENTRTIPIFVLLAHWLQRRSIV